MTAEIVLLLALALVLFVAEAHVSSGVLGILGVGALLGAGFIYRDAGPTQPLSLAPSAFPVKSEAFP